MAKVLLINPSYQPSYGGAKASIVNPIHPTLGLATIAATAKQKGHEIEILDLSWRPYDSNLIQNEIKKRGVDVVGITATTPLMNQVRDISVMIKDISQNIVVVVGGSHPSALPYETLKESLADVVCVGEADYSFAEVCDGSDFKFVKGIYYRNGEEILNTEIRPPIDNLDNLPLPAWELYDIRDYSKMSRLLCRRPPVAMAEFSRGCVFTCDFCASKITLARGYRKKSPERCAQEIIKMKELGFNEFMLADDIFTSDQAWAYSVCEAIIETGVKIIWSCTNGIRVESANDKLFEIMRCAGCYRVSFGFESGNSEVLKKFGKGGKATIEQGRKAVQKARNSGLDVNGYFLLGLSSDTEASMLDTINYARSLPLDMLKFGITIAFPGTKMFEDYLKEGLVRSFNWDDYFIYSVEPLFAHRNLSYQTIKKYMSIAYKKAILANIGFIGRRIWRGIKTGELFWDIYYALYFFMLPSVGNKPAGNYYSKERWPKHEFIKSPPKPAFYHVVKNTKKLSSPPEPEPFEMQNIS